MSAVIVQTSTHNITEVALSPDAETRRLFRSLLENLKVTSRGTGVMKIAFNQFGVATIRWAERDFPELPIDTFPLTDSQT